jgi:hypothetical protein
LEGQSCLLSGGAPDSYCSCPVPDSLPNQAQPTVADWWQLVHRTLSGAHRTVRCTPNSPVPPADRWLTGQSGEPPDNPVNYSRTPPKFSREWPVRRSWPGAPDTVRRTTGQSGAPRPSSSWLYTANSFPILFPLFLSLRYNTLVPKSMY